MLSRFDDDMSSLEQARASLYRPVLPPHTRVPLAMARERALPHAWAENDEKKETPHTAQVGVRHVRIAGVFFIGAVVFFFSSLVIAGYFYYSGGNSVSTDKVTVDIQGPTTIAGGDMVPLSLTITNRNPVAITNATIEIDFPSGTRNATNVLSTYPRYTENLGTLESGATITRSVKAVVFGGAGQALTLPVIFSYGTASSNSVFEKRSSYGLAIASTPLSVSVDTLRETVSGEPLTLALTVRSNATIPLSNIVLANALPFGFLVTSSSIPLVNSNFIIGTLAPGANKQILLTGTLSGQRGEQRVFHFTVGTAKSSIDPTLAVNYMTQDATVSITDPFITTTLALNNNPSTSAVVAPGSLQNVTMSYTNTLSMAVTNVVVTVKVTGSGINYDSIKTTNGFYNSSDHTVVFSSDTDPALAELAPGASGIGEFTFETVPSGAPSPSISFTTSVSGIRVGQTNVPEQVTSSSVTTAKIATTVTLSAMSAHSAGPVPPRANQATTYSIVWNARNEGSAVAGGTVTVTLPGYVTYTGVTSGTGFSYDSVSHTVTWVTGDLTQGVSVQGTFEVSFTPSTSQRGASVSLTNIPTFIGHDRFAGVAVSAKAGAVSTETAEGAPGNGIVQ